MTVVPLEQQLVVEAMVKPEDVETIAPGQPVRVSFPAFAMSVLPRSVPVFTRPSTRHSR